MLIHINFSTMYVYCGILFSSVWYRGYGLPVQSRMFCSLKGIGSPVIIALAPSKAARALKAYEELHWPCAVNK